MAGSITVTATRTTDDYQNRYDIAWTADGSGNVSAQPSVPLIAGQVRQVEFLPGTSPLTPPSAAYVVTLLNADGVDILLGEGAAAKALSATVPSMAIPQIQSKDRIFIESGNFTFGVSAAGAGGQGTVRIWVGP